MQLARVRLTYNIATSNHSIYGALKATLSFAYSDELRPHTLRLFSTLV